MTEPEFLDAALKNDANRELLARLRPLGLPECHLTAGCLFQTIWNQNSGHSPGWGIKDYDVFYFDSTDLSWEAEDRTIQRVAQATADLPLTIEIKNQARVHLWYPARFGGAYPQLTSTRDGIDRYLISCTCLGIDVQTTRVYAPDGFEDLRHGILRMNPRHPRADLFHQKALSYQSRWSWLTIAGEAP